MNYAIETDSSKLSVAADVFKLIFMDQIALSNMEVISHDVSTYRDITSFTTYRDITSSTIYRDITSSTMSPYLGDIILFR